MKIATALNVFMKIDNIKATRDEDKVVHCEIAKQHHPPLPSYFYKHTAAWNEDISFPFRFKQPPTQMTPTRRSTFVPTNVRGELEECRWIERRYLYKIKVIVLLILRLVLLLESCKHIQEYMYM